MSLDPNSFPRPNSPSSSDSSNRPRLQLRKEEPLRKDKNYRRYASSVERALSLFDTALQEWADYISFLSRLLKALQSHPPDLPIVPHKVLVSKRLAQCLNPSLPSGVHQKALEVYAYIFGFIKSEGLSRDLPLYLPGLAPTLSFASLTVRPLFLSLVETYICGLEPWAIRPALKAIILALLPGLEEESSDDFEPTLRLMNNFRDVASRMATQKTSAETASSGQYFWQCLFLASITNPSRRTGVLAYLNRYLPKLGVPDRRPSASEVNDSNGISHDILAAADSVVLPEPGLLIRCFASGLSDEQVLVQRSFLDLLVTHVPLNSPILQSRITDDDLQRLVVAAAGVVTRRDMSLNRRLWAWLLGPDRSNDNISFDARKSSDNTSQSADGSEFSQSEYFSRFGLKPLSNGLLEMIEQNSSITSERTKPFRIALSLMDRWEVGGFIVPAVFLPIMRNVQVFERTASKTQFDEVFRSASAFFDGVESGMIFSELLDLIDWGDVNISDRYDKIMNDLQLAHFIIEIFNVREEEMILTHIPLIVVSLLIKMGQLASVQKESATWEQRKAVSNGLMRVLNPLIGLLTDRAFTKKPGGENHRKVPNLNATEILKTIHHFYDQSKSSLELPPLPFVPRHLGELTIREAHTLAISALEEQGDTVAIQEKVNILLALLRKLPKSRVLKDKRFYSAICGRMDTDKVNMSTHSFSIISSITSAVTSLYFVHTPGFYISYEDVSDLVPTLVGRLWRFLSPVSPKFHVEAVRCLWLLHSVTWQDHLVEASVTSLMVPSPSAGAYHLSSDEQVQKYFVLWNHSHHGNYELPPKQVNDLGQSHFSYHASMLVRPLFIILDLLSQGPSETFQEVQRWLQDLPSIHKVFRIVISQIDDLFFRSAQSGIDTETTTVSPDDYKECNYLLRTTSNIVSALSHNGWATLLTHTLSQGDKHQDGLPSEDQPGAKSLHSAIFDACLRIVSGQSSTIAGACPEEVKLQQTSFLLIKQLLLGPGADDVADSGIDTFLVERLTLVLDHGGSVVLQEAIIDALLAVLKVRFAQAYLPPPPPRPKQPIASSRERLTSPSLLSFTSDKADKAHVGPPLPQPPEQLLNCLLKGISSPNSREIVEKWTSLLCEALPLYPGTIFQILLVLVECFCREIRLSYANLQLAFKKTEDWPEDRSEHVTIALLAGLETCIATAHDRLLIEEANAPAVKSPDQPQGFFGNMVSGVFTSDANHNRSNAANNRLTVLLCFQDAVRLCFSIWSWDTGDRSGLPQDTESLASFQYTSLRMRNRSRRILEHLFTAETLECLETLVEMWTKADTNTSSLIFNLLHTLDGSRPKVTIPALFNAIYTRTNPSALDPNRKSAMTSNIGESELAAFLVTYARSLDDDVLDEIWIDCTTFLRDVLSNPFPHRQILPRLVEFAAILGAKMENTSFGEDRRMRRELGDVLVRLLAAIFTSKPLGLSQDSGFVGRSSFDNDSSSVAHVGPDDMLSILAVSMPAFTSTLGDSDRISTALNGISINIIGPFLRSRLFPNNINRNFMVVLQHMAKVPAAAKSWKKDIADAFNDPRYFGSSLDLVKDGWMNLLRQWVLADRDRLSELMSRLQPPSTAGIMFGVGASAARLEADRKAQLNLRRIALLILSANNDYFVGELPGLLQKLEDLLGATNSSSPSSATRAEVFMVLRALVLKTSGTAFAPFWPLVNTELQEAISTVPQGQQSDLFSPYSMLQACKLLDTLLVLAPDDFQLLEWLFVTDTIDAVYPPERWEPTALADEVSQSFGQRSAASSVAPGEIEESAHGEKHPWLVSDWIRETAKDELVERVLRPFFDRLTIHAFESTYSMGSPNLEACRDDLLADLFNETTMAN